MLLNSTNTSANLKGTKIVRISKPNSFRKLAHQDPISGSVDSWYKVNQGRSVTPKQGEGFYNVRRALSYDIVDPGGYNFFQFQPHSSIGWLWLTRAMKRGREVTVVDPLGPDGTNGVDPLETDDWEFRRYDHACLYKEYKRKKTFASVPAIAEDIRRIVDAQNELLGRRFLSWQFINKETHESIALQNQGDTHPMAKSFKFLKITMELFRDKICRNASSYAVAVRNFAPPGAIKTAMATGNPENKLLPKPFIEELFRLFLTIREITLDKNVPDYAGALDEEQVFKEVLEKCQREEISIKWFSHSCGDKVIRIKYNLAKYLLIRFFFNLMLVFAADFVQ